MVNRFPGLFRIIVVRFLNIVTYGKTNDETFGVSRNFLAGHDFNRVN